MKSYELCRIPVKSHNKFTAIVTAFDCSNCQGISPLNTKLRPYVDEIHQCGFGRNMSTDQIFAFIKWGGGGLH
jgi:hypothetical protein